MEYQSQHLKISHSNFHNLVITSNLIQLSCLRFFYNFPILENQIQNIDFSYRRVISILVDETYQISSNGLISPLHNRQPASTNRHQKTYRLTKTTIPRSRSSDRSTNCCYQFSPSYFLCIDHPNAEIPRTHCATSKPITDLSSDCCTQEN